MTGIKAKWLSLADKIKNVFAQRIFNKYKPSAVTYFDSAYMVLLVVKKTPREGIVPLYARSQYINHQVKQYAGKEIIREIRYEIKPAEGANIFQTYNPARFFENMNISTRREWGKIFYSFSKEYEVFYREQYHQGPKQEPYYEEVKMVIKKEIMEETICHTKEGMIHKEAEVGYRKQEVCFRELEEKVKTCISRITIQEEITKKQSKVGQEEALGKIEVDIKAITGEVMENLRRHLELERMRHGF